MLVRDWHVPCCSCFVERGNTLNVNLNLHLLTFRRTAMTTLMIKDLPLIEELSDDAAKNIVGGMINNHEDGPQRKSAPQPLGGTGYNDLLLHYTLTMSSPIPGPGV
jgi:hypothetical protein